MKQYKAYAFDLDLTLLNTLETSLQAYKAAFKAFNQDFDKKDVVRHLAIPLVDSFKEVINKDKPYEVFLNAFVDTARRTFLDGSFFYEDALEYLKKLYDDGYMLGIVTNRDLLVVEAALKKAGIRHYFSSIITNEKVSKLKPDPEPINKCLEELGVTKEEMVYFGDAKNDWMSACNAGVDFIAVERYDNCKYDAKERIHSFKELVGGIVMDKYIAICGLDCEHCEARKATVNNDDELRKKVAKQWSEWNKVEITPDMINCVGCRIDGVKCQFCDSLCPIRICCNSKGFETCGDCEQLETCETIKMIVSHNKEALERLRKNK